VTDGPGAYAGWPGYGGTLGGAGLGSARHGAASVALVPRQERNQWRMPPLALLKPVTWSPALKLAMIALLGYLVVAALLLLIKAIQLGTG
jgi:hypothetical protein